jgi:hypothetical protein
VVHHHPLPEGGGFLTGDVTGEFLEHCPCARHPFVPHEAHRPAADIFVDLPEWVGRGDARRHDEATRPDKLA